MGPLLTQGRHALAMAQAHERGQHAAERAASWAADGNVDLGMVRHVLAKIEAGDPEVEFYLPAIPTLSGEWAGDPTPWTLAADLVDDFDEMDLDAAADLMDEIASAFDEGVAETFEAACERTLMAWAA